MKIRRIRFFSALVVTICVVGGGEVNAATVFVANPSFESPAVPDFVGSIATGWVGSMYNPTNANYAGTTGSGTPPGGDGAQLAFLSGGIGFTSQVLRGVDDTPGTADDPLVTANTLYSLSVAIGAGLDAPYSGYSIELGAYSLTSGYIPFGIQTNTITPSAGQLLDTTLLVDTTGISPSLIGQNLAIVLRNTTATFSRTDFDNVRLSATAVPEPSSVMLWGAGAFVLGIFRLRRIDRNAVSGDTSARKWPSISCSTAGALALLSICANDGPGRDRVPGQFQSCRPAEWKHALVYGREQLDG